MYVNKSVVVLFCIKRVSVSVKTVDAIQMKPSKVKPIQWQLKVHTMICLLFHFITLFTINDCPFITLLLSVSRFLCNLTMPIAISIFCYDSTVKNAKNERKKNTFHQIIFSKKANNNKEQIT
uniref:Uncharacterized protein n=1 Tax=Glossina palpalis gambiensis TaxID=67801 RepID=A0A1B0BQ95_9MUSC